MRKGSNFSTSSPLIIFCFTNKSHPYEWDNIYCNFDLVLSSFLNGMSGN